ncbi:electron transfer flavoprotein subunit alpha/FixB family protein [Parasphaerochaeta coccoides]|uniref:Electron transfer flavoprotein alpha subunit n=1 Tax=Parasphaerochaeta coccoides (strain ATCC BAA-1237 / DSM 17374 / SPN1) TaxID=760011 RepID=F4GIU1_PARC1|nr:electron transfer flavoprotein subunit alpha/FixB family protein [Parasphaerochaeta coccoides]AEC02709.1 Electron transfer flavoprotein alpha subunit [Parasphaerochaeta coccoides DSM 17374]
MHDVWTLAECHGTTLKDVSYELLAWGRTLADSLRCKLCSVVIGDIPDDEIRLLFTYGADCVYVVTHEQLGWSGHEVYVNILTGLSEEHKPEIFLGAATTSGRSIFPALAVRLRTGLTADCTELSIEEKSGNLLQTRPAIGGNIMATIKTPEHRPQMATVRAKSIRHLPADSSRKGEIVRVPWNPAWQDERVTVLGTRKEHSDQGSIMEAEIVVAGGKGLKKKENFRLIEDLAHALGGQVGATRDAVDRGWKGYPHQVGLSGKTISPRLYMGIGISGAVQHMAGIKTAECIVAINADERANLLRVADFALVGDLFEIVPELLRRLNLALDLALDFVLEDGST